jgi:hypothetical protein
MLVRAAQLQLRLGTAGELRGQRVQHDNPLGHHRRPAFEGQGVVGRAQVPFERVDLPCHADIVEPGVWHCDEPSHPVVELGVPQRLREPAAEGDLAGVRLCDRPHSVADLDEHLARQLDSPAAAVGELIVEFRGGAAPTLHDFGDQSPDLVPVREAPGGVERGPADRRQRPPPGNSRWQAFGALGKDETGAGASALGRDEHVDRARRPRHPLHSVQLERVEPGEDGALARVKQCRLPPLPATRWRVVELDDSRQHSPPRSTSPAAVGDSAPGEAESHQVVDAHDGGSAERGE